MAQDWDIRPRSDSCQACEKQFEDGESYCSALMIEESGYVRGDYCEDCWSGKDLKQKAFSSWQGVYVAPPPEPEDPLKKETAESLLRRLIEEDSVTRGDVIYILVVMLERKKLLVEKDVRTTDEGELVRVYEHKQTGETFVIVDPRLRLDELESVQEQVVVLLGGKPRPQAPEAGEEVDADEEEESEDGDDTEND